MNNRPDNAQDSEIAPLNLWSIEEKPTGYTGVVIYEGTLPASTLTNTNNFTLSQNVCGRESGSVSHLYNLIQASQALLYTPKSSPMLAPPSTPSKTAFSRMSFNVPTSENGSISHLSHIRYCAQPDVAQSFPTPSTPKSTPKHTPHCSPSKNVSEVVAPSRLSFYMDSCYEAQALNEGWSKLVLRHPEEKSTGESAMIYEGTPFPIVKRDGPVSDSRRTSVSAPSVQILEAGWSELVEGEGVVLYEGPPIEKRDKDGCVSFSRRESVNDPAHIHFRIHFNDSSFDLREDKHENESLVVPTEIESPPAKKNFITAHCRFPFAGKKTKPPALTQIKNGENQERPTASCCVVS